MARPPSARFRDLTFKGLGVAVSLMILAVAITGVVALAGAFSHPDLVKRTLLSPAMLTGYGRERDVWLVSLGALNVCFGLFIAVVAWIGSGSEWQHTREGPKELLFRLAIVWLGFNGLVEIAHVAMGWATTLSVAFAASSTRPGQTSANSWHAVMATMAGGGVLIDVVYMGIIAFGFGLLLAHLVSSLMPRREV